MTKNQKPFFYRNNLLQNRDEYLIAKELLNPINKLFD